MENEKTLAQVADSTLEEPLRITVDVRPQSFLHQKMQQWRWKPKKKEFLLYPICLGNLIRISKLLLSIKLDMPDTKDPENSAGSLMDVNYKAMSEHSYTLAEIVALALQNNKQAASPVLIRFILQNFTSKEMMGVLTLVIKQMDLANFMSSIISVRGLNVLASQAAAPAMNVNGNGVSL